MLLELSIRNLAVVEAVDLSFDTGLHVLTGETGAGKSILIDAISLVLGGRGSVEYVRHGTNKAEITALFELAKAHPAWQTLHEFGLGADGEGHILIKRDISRHGKSVCRINGHIVTLTMLRQLGNSLVDIHGQHDHQSLLREEEHVNWLDDYAGEPLKKVKSQYRELYERYRRVEEDIRRLNEDERQTAQRIDLLEFQLNEIAAASLIPGEDKRLLERRTKLVHLEKIVQHVQEAYHALRSDNQALNDIGHALSAVGTVAEYDTELKGILELIQNAYYQLEEAQAALGRLAEQQEFDQGELNNIEARLHVIEQLKRKYAPSIDEIIQYGRDIEVELDALKNRERHTRDLQKQANELRAELTAKARQLSTKRKEAAERLQREVERELKELHMKHTRFDVEMRTEEGKFFSHGADQLKFVISANPGEPMKPLAKTASGGELSRIMLALKTIFHEVDEMESLIFDEIDTGVGGRAAQAIAEKMHRIAGGKQVLCVTHLPQVACMADRHVHIAKRIKSGQTMTQVRVLDEQERIEELARMLGGVEVTHKTKQHAEEMLRLAKSKKGA